MMKLPKKKGLDFNELLKDVNPVAVDLIKRMLAFDPANRITVE
jgi:serine/threonine protein kinase